KGYWDSGCSRHMTGNISYLSEYEPYDGGYVSFGHGGGKITGKGIIKTGKLEFENVYFLKELKCDNEGEFKNQEMNEFCTKKGIRREFSNARTPQQNRVAERRNITLIEAARTMLADAKLPVTFGLKQIPAIGFLRPFGCPVMILNTLDHLGKFDSKGDEGYFVGYSLSSKAFRVFNKRTKKVEENLHVDFLKNKLIEKGVGPNWLFDIDTLTNLMNYVPVVVAGTSSTNISGTKDVASQAVKKDVSSLRYNALPNWFHEAHMETSNDTIRNSDAQDDSKKNKIAMLMFLKAEESKKIFDALKDPRVRPIGTKWVLKNKKDERGIVIRNKARLVAQGYTQEEGINYEEVIAPVARIEAIRLFLAYASFMGFIVYQMDVKSAFLYGTIDEEVYVMQPPGFQDPEFPEKVYKVEKAMYGLHQAPRAWYGTLSKYLLDNGFQRGTTDQTLFIRKHKGEFLLVQVYVLQKKDGIFLSQDKYVGDILKKFGYSDVRSTNTPMDKENPWRKYEPSKDVELHLYRSMIGSLMYLIASRADIMFAVCACARHQVTPEE
nr:retrovirus-related Pol polyprotein from transposon TNT 1-94 [Tanacetum cinerariifolium]